MSKFDEFLVKSQPQVLTGNVLEPSRDRLKETEKCPRIPMPEDVSHRIKVCLTTVAFCITFRES